MNQSEVNKLIALYSKTHYIEAIDVAQKLLIKNPDIAIYHNIIGACRAGQKEFSQAIESYKQALLLDPNYTEVYVNIGQAYFNLQQKDMAIKSFQRALKLDSKNIEAHNNMGVIFASEGNFENAQESFAKTVALDKAHAGGHANLGNALKQLGQLAKAEQSFKTAIEITPQNPELYNSLGTIQQSQGKLDAAIKQYEKALELNNNYGEVYNNLGGIFAYQTNYKKAALCFRQALSINPGNVEAHTNLGTVCKNLGDLNAAIENFKQAISINPKHAHAYLGLGEVYRKQFKEDQAVTSYQQALKLNPKFIQAHHNLGVLYTSTGELVDAKNSFIKVLNIKSDDSLAHRHLSPLKDYKPNDPHIQTMEASLQDSKITRDDEINFNFALSKAYKDLQHYKTSYIHLKDANDLCDKKFEFNIDNEVRIFNHIKSIFNISTMPILDESECNPLKKMPIFILGMPRSGTTLVEQILASHPEVYGGGELPILGNLATQFLKKLNSEFNTSPNYVLRNEIIALRNNYASALSGLNSDLFFITDKMPANFMWLGLILCALPEAKIIHLNRDPIATCWSIYKTYFSKGGNGYSYNIENLGKYYGLYKDLMIFWNTIFTKTFYEVSYEKLTENQFLETKNLLHYCGLEWSSNCLDFHVTKRTVNTASNAQVRKKMYSGSSSEWKHYEEYIKPLINALD